MQLLDGQLVLSPTDLTEHLACAHLTELRRAVLRGELPRPYRDDPHAEIVARRGDEHEARHLAALRAEGRRVVEIDRPAERSLPALGARAQETLDAMRAGADVVFQATFLDGAWRGHADFLERVEGRSALGDWHYEVVDTKLARGAKPAHVLQLCAYSAHVGRLQGTAPARAHLVLGDGTRASFPVAAFAAVHRRAAARLEARLAGEPVATYPEPVEHCRVCDFAGRCWAQRRRDDHLSLVAGARRDQREDLVMVGLPTVRALGEASPDHPTGKLVAPTFARLRSQAALQLRTRDTGRIARRDLAPEPGRGYARLPAPDPADVFFDLEGDPFVESAGAEGGSGVRSLGLEYLWGFELDGELVAWWAHDGAEERRVFERFVDLVLARWRAHPGMHVFHYAPHEAATLKRLAAHHGTREDEVDELLRGEVLVDLYAVLRQAMQVGQESYSIKAVEPLYMPPRATEVTEAGGSIVAYETWLTSGDPGVLDAIRAYNRDDVVSTRLLRDWLLECRAAAEAQGTAFVPAPVEEPRPEPAWWPEHLARLERLRASLPEDPADDDPDAAERRLLAGLLDYHRREARPQWWRHFELRTLTEAELVDDVDAIGGLSVDPGAEPEQIKKSTATWLRFAPQEHRLGLGDVLDPATGQAAGEIERFDVPGSRLLLKRGPKFDETPPPSALIGPKPFATTCQREALAEVAEAVLGGDRDAFAAVRSVLRREPPAVLVAAAPGGLVPAPDLPAPDLAAPGAPAPGAPTPDPPAPAAPAPDLAALVAGMGAGHLVVQGPPGSGKTHQGARLVVALLARGWRVGVAASGHKAVHNLLAEVERVAAARGVEVRGYHKAGDAGSIYRSAHGLVASGTSNPKAERGELNLVAGTPWLLSRPAFRREDPLDVLVVDEAGQVALADAVAMGAGARRLVLLGDPQQLPQVTQADHPGSSGCSVLAHLLGGEPTIPPDRGVFLAHTRRLHPAITGFVSEAFYDGRLASTPECARRRVAPGGAGLRHLAVEHEGNAQASPEEAEAIAAACRELIGGEVVEPDGRTRKLGPEDILVVAPYNLAVRAIARTVPAGVRVGTVDKFQGQEAPVVFFALTSSSGEDVPRGLEFLLSARRLNVAISRAQCLAVLVAAPRLLDAQARTVEQLRLLDAACRFVELADAG